MCDCVGVVVVGYVLDFEFYCVFLDGWLMNMCSMKFVMVGRLSVVCNEVYGISYL